MAYFYSSIHLIEAILHRKYGIDPKKHQERLLAMQDHNKTFFSVLNKYGCLSILAHTARYLGTNEIDPKDALKAQEYFEDIEQCLQVHLL